MKKIQKLMLAAAILSLVVCTSACNKNAYAKKCNGKKGIKTPMGTM